MVYFSLVFDYGYNQLGRYLGKLNCISYNNSCVKYENNLLYTDSQKYKQKKKT